MHRCYFILLFCFGFITINAQEKNNFNTYHFLSVKGLTNNTIHCILQDNRGFIWIGTEDGLNMYDGQTVKQYYLSDYIPAQFNSNTIENICEDTDGNLLIAAKSGIIKFNWSTKQFLLIYKNDFASFGNQFPDLFIDAEKNIWISERVRLKKFDAHFHLLQTWILHDNTDKKIFSGPNTTKIQTEDNQHNIWLTVPGAVIKIDVRTGKIDSTANTNLHKIFSKNTDIVKLQFYDGEIFVLINGRTIFKSDVSFKQPPQFIITDTAKKGFIDFATSRNHLFIITGNAEVLMVDESGEIIEQYKKQNAVSLSGNMIIMRDKDGNLWTGTEKGIDELTIKAPLFYLIPFNNPTKFSHFSLSGISIQRNLLHAFSTLGIINYNINKNSTEYFFNKINNQFSGIYFSAFYPYKNYWLASTPIKLYIAVQKNNYLLPEAFNFKQAATLDSTGVFAFYQDKKNNIWMGLYNDAGIVCWHTNSNQFEFYSQKDTGKYYCPLRHFKYATEDNNGNIWMGYEKGGLAIFNVQLQKFIPLPFDKNNSFGNVAVSGMLNDDKGNLWIATNAGLICYNQNTKSYTILVRKSGLPSNLMESIQKDEDGNLWAGFQGAICKINCVTKKIDVFTTADGLPDDDFENAAYDAASKKMFFTGNDELIYFYPSQLKKNITALEPVITGLEVMGKNEPLIKNEKINLSYSQNYITFNFSAPNYINAAENEYACMLAGADKNWNILDNQQTISYSQLQPGNYIFYLKVRIADGTWHDAQAPVFINISKPFWLTTWFRILCGAVLLLVVFAFAYLRLHNKYEQQILSQNIRDKIAGDLHDDIGSTLSSVTILSELAKQKYSEAVPLLERITKNISSVQENMSDIVWSINPRNDSFANIIQRMSQFAAELLEPKNMMLNFTADDALLSLSLPMEKRRSLYLFFKEAINNCAKYSCATKVDVHLSQKENIVCMIISDNGKGFDTNKNYKGNGMATMYKRATELNGNLNINSVLEEGAFIELDFKV